VTPDVDVRTLRALVRHGVDRIVVSVRDTRTDELERATRATINVVRRV
jgi:hypothetical protein